MFIREKKTRNLKNGNVYIKHILVESYHTEKGSRQRTIMQLGKISLPRKYWSLLAKELEHKLAGEELSEQMYFLQNNKTKQQLEVEDVVRSTADKALEKFHILKKTHKATKSINAFVPFEQHTIGETEKNIGETENTKTNYQVVDCNSITSSFSRSLGSELVGHHAFKQLQFPEILKNCNFSTREISLSESIIVGRLISPGSELSTWNWLRNKTALSEITQVPLTNVKKDALYEISDVLLRHKKDIEKHLLNREKALFPNRQSLYLFDLTNFYMEGQCANNDLAKFGKSKEKRNDQRLISLALMVDSDGFPIASRVYEGNIGEPATLEDVLRDIGYIKKNNQMEIMSIKPMLAMDRGIATTENLKLIKDWQFPYVIIERSPRHKKYVSDFEDYQNKFELIKGDKQKGVWVHKVEDIDDKKCLILCVSDGRKEKEKAIADRWIDRAIKDLEKLHNSIQKGNIKILEKVYQRLGKIKGRYKGFGKRFTEKIISDDAGKKAVGIEWTVVDTTSPEKETLFGCYVIETNQIHQTAKNIWHLYTTLTRVEAAFQSLKTDLGTRPIYHQLAHRTEAHIFISVLAYHLLITIEYQLSQHNDYRTWKTIRSVLETHRRDTIIFTDKEKIIHHIRQSGQPESSHADIYKKLKVKNPLLRNHYTVGKRT
jgi:hypothetical protein